MSLPARDPEIASAPSNLADKNPTGDHPDDVAVPRADVSAGRALAIVAVLCFGGLVAAVMQTLIIPIQPELPPTLGTTLENASWVITATLLGGAAPSI